MPRRFFAEFSTAIGQGPARASWAALTSIAVLACCGGSNRGTARHDMDLADRYERGDGVPRDYRRAAELLIRSCDSGRGVASACRRLASAATKARGLPENRLVGPLVAAACQGGDWIACGASGTFSEHKARAACDTGVHEACLAVADLAALRTSGGAQDERWRYIDQACRAGVLDGCFAVAAVGFEPADSRRQVASTQLGAACRRGDADACAAIDLPLAPHELCDAGDYQACARVGAAGDAAALKQACDQRVLDACERIALTAVDADPADPRTLEYLERACKLGSSKACKYDRPSDLATGCAAYGAYVIETDRRRQIPPLHGIDAHGRPWAGPRGPVLIVAAASTIPWSAYDEVARRLDVPVVVSARAEQLVAPPPLARAVAVLLDRAFFTAQLVSPGLHDLSAYRVANVNLLVDEHGTVRAFLGAGPLVPATYARCVRHLLETP